NARAVVIAAVASSRHCWYACPWVIFTTPLWAKQGACRPTQIGMNRQPCAVTAEIHSALKLPYPQAQFAPPRYVPVIRYGEASQAVIVSVDGAVQVSKASPRPTLRTSGAVAAGWTGGGTAGVTARTATGAPAAAGAVAG